MKRFKIRTMQSKAPVLYTKSLDQGYGIDLSTSNSLYKLGIHGASEIETPSSGPTRLSHLGDRKEDGSYEIPLHCHGENLLGGEEFAAAMLAAAEANSYATASVEDNILTFTSRTNCVLFPAGRLRGANPEVFSIMFTFTAPENAGSITATSIAFTFQTGIQNISYNSAYNGETVQILTNSNAKRQVINLSLATSVGKRRIIDLSTFGIFRGAANKVSYSPYWGEKTAFSLSEPLRRLSSAEDIAYPLQGYAIRNVRSAAYTPTDITAISLGSDHPTYQLPIPEALWERDLQLDHFTSAESESALIATPFSYMRTSDKRSFLVTASEDYSTAAAFLELFNSLGVHIDYKACEPLIERFSPIKLTTRAGRNYIDLMTAVTPKTIDFTYA